MDDKAKKKQHVTNHVGERSTVNGAQSFDLLFKFKQRLTVLNRSAATIKAYINILKVFLCVLGEADMKRVTRSMVEAYVAGLSNKRYRTGSICVIVRSIKRFFEFLEKANIIFINPAETLREPKKETGLIRDVLTPQEARTILDQPNLGTLKGIRDRTILEVFYSTGIRLNELCSLTIYDADLQGQTLRINQGKGKKDRVVPMGKHAVRFLREYIAKVRPHFTGQRKKPASSIQYPASSIQQPGCKPELNRSLFVNRYGKQISIQAVEKMVKAYARATSIKKQVTPHTFRHSFATSLVRNGADIVAVQKMLGHACLNTTQVYIRALGLDLKRVHQKTHPREKDKEKIVPKVRLK